MRLVSSSVGKSRSAPEAIPDLRALAGITLHSQAMLLSPPFPAVLTNGTADVILR